MIDRKVFFDNVRDSVFRGSLGQGQVDGLDSLIDMWEANYPDLIEAGFAYILASCYHESAYTMQPVRETLASTDAAAIRILDRAWARGQLKGVRAPYWRDGWFGRGLIQITLKDNYRRMTQWLRDRAGLDVDLVANRDLALEPDVSARVAFEGIIHGLFRNGHWLAKYVNDSKTDFVGARAIVNGRFRNDHNDIAAYAKSFNSALLRARAAYTPPAPDAPKPSAVPNAAEWRLRFDDMSAALNDLPEGSVKTGLATALALYLLRNHPPDGALIDLTPAQPADPAGLFLPKPERSPTMQGDKHPLASKTIHGALTAFFGMALPALAPLIGVTVTPEDGNEALGAISQIVTAGGILYAVYGRVVATKRISI